RNQVDEQESQRRGVRGDGVAGALVHRVEQDRQVLDRHEPERQAHERHPQRVDDHGGSGKSQDESRKLSHRWHSAEAVERVAREREPEHDVREPPDVEPAERHEPLGVHRLREHEIEAPAPHLSSRRVHGTGYAAIQTPSHTSWPAKPCPTAGPCAAPVRSSTGKASMYGNHESAATPATAGGSSAGGASRPERNSDTPACSSMIAVARVVQNASRPVVKLMKNRIAAASSTAA